jgi:hypothetical protein
MSAYRISDSNKGHGWRRAGSMASSDDGFGTTPEVSRNWRRKRLTTNKGEKDIQRP